MAAPRLLEKYNKLIFLPGEEGKTRKIAVLINGKVAPNKMD